MLAIILSKIIFAGNVNFTEEYYIYTYILSTLQQVLFNTCIYFEFECELTKKFDIKKLMYRTVHCVNSDFHCFCCCFQDSDVEIQWLTVT